MKQRKDAEDAITAFFDQNEIECVFVSEYAVSRIVFHNAVQKKRLSLYRDGKLSIQMDNHRTEKIVYHASNQVAQAFLSRIPLDVWQAYIHSMMLYIPYYVLSHTVHLLDVYGKYSYSEQDFTNDLHQRRENMLKEYIDLGDVLLQRYGDIYFLCSNNYEEPSFRCFLSLLGSVELQNEKASVIVCEYIARCQEMKSRVEKEVVYFRHQMEEYQTHFLSPIKK